MSANTGQNILATDMNNIGHFVAGEAISSGDAVSLNYSDYKIYKASANAFDHRLNFIGFAMASAVLNGAVSVNVLTVVNEKTGLSNNTIYYLSNTQGAIGTSAGTYERIIGRTVTTSKIIRKRGVVSKPIAISGTTAPCDGYFYGEQGSVGQLTVDSITFDVDTGAGMMAKMGAGIANNLAGGGKETFFVIMDFGGFY